MVIFKKYFTRECVVFNVQVCVLDRLSLNSSGSVSNLSSTEYQCTFYHFIHVRRFVWKENWITLLSPLLPRVGHKFNVNKHNATVSCAGTNERHFSEYFWRIIDNVLNIILMRSFWFTDDCLAMFSGKCKSKARLDGKTAIVTGSNTGIGKITAREFYKLGKYPRVDFFTF